MKGGISLPEPINITITINTSVDSSNEEALVILGAVYDVLTAKIQSKTKPTVTVTSSKPVTEPEPEPEPEPKTIKSTETPEPQISIETVRAKCAELSKAGRQAELKTIFKQFGASKLNEIPVDKYAELIAAVEAIL